MELQWEDRVERALEDLAAGQRTLAAKFSELGVENAVQHGEMGKYIERLHGENRAEIRELAAQFRRALEDANRKLESKHKAVKVLTYAVILLAGILLGVKSHALGMFKEIGL
jgi:hypothetical protein